ncbi:kinase-like domain-containing protein [Crassisporium funariophilum]|nr:kinase-like domain-containing protein [Crassisporium funariophilum]
MTPRKVRGAKGRRAREEEERTRVGFVREVEVLKHISHPNITPLLAHLSTASHHILVLPYLPGGDLLGLVNNDVAWGKLGESVLRRIWCELCKAVGWMHGVGLVHRDIKLENILLTTPAFTSLLPSSPPPTLASLPPPPLPFLKLTDFGLSRFVSIAPNGDAELLSTRCGSEAYAAPELVTGGRGFAYDARGTDAWACGVVLYALVGRRLPFGEGVSVAGAREGEGRRIGGERGAGAGEWSLKERRGWLVSIAKGEYEWPGGEGEDEGGEDSEELVGTGLVKSRGARRVVGRLLVRDPRKRARIGDLWDDVWMSGGDEQSQSQKDDRPPVCEEVQADSVMCEEGDLQQHEHGDDHEHEHSWLFDGDSTGPSTHMHMQEDEEVTEEEEEEEEGGCLLDQEGIDSITRQEVV